MSGLIGFVGLVVPHMLRLLVGNDYRYLLPLSCLGGGVLLVFADAIARSWFDPIELPVRHFTVLLQVVRSSIFNS